MSGRVVILACVNAGAGLVCVVAGFAPPWLALALVISAGVVCVEWLRRNP